MRHAHKERGLRLRSNVCIFQDMKPLPSSYERVPELDTPRYVLGDVAAAANVSPGTLKAWLSREPQVIHLGPYDQPGRGKGTPRLLTLRRLYAIAIASELVSLGFAPSRAGMLAFAFTDVNIEASRAFVESRRPVF